MDLSLSDEQRLLGDAADRFAAGRYSFDARRVILQLPEGFSRDIWREFADLGWLGISISEDHRGLGAGPVETAILMETFGKALVVEPYLSTVILSAGLIDAIGSPEQKTGLLPGIAEGKLLMALAHVEPQSRFALEDVATTAKREGAGWTLSGRKHVVLGGPSADTLIVSARIAGDQKSRNGIGLFLVPSKSAGVSRMDYQTLDGGRASNIELANVSVDADALLGSSDDALPAIERVTDHAIAAMASEAVGCMQMLLDTTIAYTKTRVQFGKPLSDNQVLRHRMAAMAIKIEEARAIALKAALTMDADPVARARAASAAKTKAGRAGRFVAEQAVQLHGGMGVTEELNVGVYLKRLMAIEVIFGSPDHHVARYAQLDRSTDKAA